MSTAAEEAERILSKRPLLLNTLSQKIRPKADHVYRGSIARHTLLN